MVAYTVIYTLLRRIAFKAITFSKSRACFIALHVCSGKIHFRLRLQKFNLETCSEKPEVDIVCPHLSLKPKLFTDNVTKKTTVTFS